MIEPEEEQRKEISENPDLLGQGQVETILVNQVYGFWGTLLWGAAIIISFVLVQSITLLIFAIKAGGNIANEESLQLVLNDLQFNGTVISAMTITTALVMVPTILTIIAMKDGASIKNYLGWQWFDLKTFFMWLGIVLVSVVLSNTLLSQFGTEQNSNFMTDVYSSASPMWLLWIAMCLAAPAFEEVLFRSFLLSGLSETFLGTTGAVIFSALAWALIHAQYDIIGMLSIFILGLVLGLAWIKTRSLMLCIILHGIVNVFASIETLLLLSE